MTALGPGIRVKCIKRDGWKNIGLPDRPPSIGPPFGSIWTIFCFSSKWGREFIVLEEWPDRKQTFRIQGNFVPLDGNEDISELESALKKGETEGDRERREILEIAELIRTGAAEYAP